MDIVLCLLIAATYLCAVMMAGMALLVLELWWKGMPAWLRLQVPAGIPEMAPASGGFWIIVGRVPVYFPGRNDETE